MSIREECTIKRKKTPLDIREGNLEDEFVFDYEKFVDKISEKIETLQLEKKNIRNLKLLENLKHILIIS